MPRQEENVVQGPRNINAHQIVAPDVVANQQRAAQANQQINLQGNQQRAAVESQYEGFIDGIKNLPGEPVQNPNLFKANANLSYKERKERDKAIKQQKEAYRKLGKETHLLKIEDIARLQLLRTEHGRNKWLEEKLPHSTQTREEALREVLDHQNYSNFENLDGVMRNVVANAELSKFIKKYGTFIKEDGDAKALCEKVYGETAHEGVSALLNPGLRLGLSMAQRTDGIPEKIKTFYRRLDEEMSAKVMEVTLTHHVNDDKSKLMLKEHFRDKKEKDPQKKTDEAIKAHRAQQIQIAKRLLMVHLSKLTKVTKDAAGVKHNEEWNEENPTPVSVLFSHCSRVTVTLPRKVEREGSGNASEYHDRMWRAITTINGGNSAQDNRRGGSTHSVKRRKVADTGGVTSTEKKVLVNAIGQRGMNCAIGGLGNAGIGKKMLNNDGSCGHFYSMYKEADTRHYGAMLMGLESDANGVTNQMGHTHDIHATPEKASSLGGQRVDEIGEKYGGRQCDLTGLSAKEIEAWMLGLERFMQSAHQQFYKEDPLIDDSYHKEYFETMKILAGKKISDRQRDDLFQTLGIGKYLGKVHYT